MPTTSTGLEAMPPEPVTTVAAVCTVIELVVVTESTTVTVEHRCGQTVTSVCPGMMPDQNACSTAWDSISVSARSAIARASSLPTAAQSNSADTVNGVAARTPELTTLVR